jgi:hypothetical protein
MLNLEQIKDIAENGCDGIKCSECTMLHACSICYCCIPEDAQRTAKAVLFGYEAGLKRGYDLGYKVGSL